MGPVGEQQWLAWRVFEPAGEQPLVSVEERYLLSYSVTGTEPVADDIRDYARSKTQNSAI